MTVLSRTRRRTAAALVLAAAAALAVGPVATGSPLASAAARPHDDTDSSAVTVHGSGPFAGLEVTVHQTENLSNQVVEVSWTGAKAPPVQTGTPSVDFMQIMQCWGNTDNPLGPDRTNCEFGGLERTVGTVASRRVSVVHDPNEPLTQGNPAGDVYVPFVAADGGSVPGDARSNTYFDASTSNEVALGRVRSDGTGREFFEVLTGGQSPGLGCGNAITDGTGARIGTPCWLVIVPRGETEVDGTDRSGASSALESSPLSQSNWANRLVVPLHFSPVGVNCPLGSAEHRIYGQQLAAQAIYRWEPALCDTTGAVFGFSSVNDNIARRQLVSGQPDMQVVSEPVAPSDLPAGKAPVYAPITLSAPAILFNINWQAFSGPAAARNGIRIDSIDLTPRLVAKLLTESYQYMDSLGLPYLQQNATDIFNDPDFLQYNTQFAVDAAHPTTSALRVHPGQIVMPSALSDASKVLWAYVNADPEARAWLDGAADPWGMTVNPFFKNLALPRQDFPKADLNCQTAQNSQYCILDSHPYGNDPFAIARSVSRGDGLTRSPQSFPYPADPPQPSGFRSLFAVSDLPDAALYALPIANLRNADGEFVAPTTASMRAAVAAMTVDSATQTLSLDPTKKVPGAYPTAMVTYAATVPSDLSAADGKAYAQFIRYAVDDGQVAGDEPGQLPGGYFALPAPLVARAESVATIIDAQSGQDATPSASASATPSPAAKALSTPRVSHTTGPTGGGSTPTTATASSSPVAQALVPVPSAGASGLSPAGGVPSPAVAPSPSSGPPQLVSTARTPTVSAGASRLVPVLVLVLAAIGLGTGFGAPSVLLSLRPRRASQNR